MSTPALLVKGAGAAAFFAAWSPTSHACLCLWCAGKGRASPGLWASSLVLPGWPGFGLSLSSREWVPETFTFFCLCALIWNPSTKPQTRGCPAGPPLRARTLTWVQAGTQQSPSTPPEQDCKELTLWLFRKVICEEY